MLHDPTKIATARGASKLPPAIRQAYDKGLGIECSLEPDRNKNRNNISIDAVVPGSVAGKLGLKKGDTITEINGVGVRGLGSLEDALATKNPLKLKVITENGVKEFSNINYFPRGYLGLSTNGTTDCFPGSLGKDKFSGKVPLTGRFNSTIEASNAIKTLGLTKNTLILGGKRDGEARYTHFNSVDDLNAFFRTTRPGQIISLATQKLGGDSVTEVKFKMLSIKDLQSSKGIDGLNIKKSF